jgi:hypothetical protein
MSKKLSAAVEPSNLVKDGNVVAAIIPLFGDVVVTLPDGDPAVYQGRGGASTRAFNISVPVNLVAKRIAHWSNGVYARMQSDGTLKIDVSVPKGIKVDSETRDDFRSHVLSAISSSPYFRKGMKDAHKVLTAPPKAAVKAGVKVIGATSLSWSPDDDDEPGSGEAVAAAVN